MAYTASDLTAVEAAVTALANGERVVIVDLDGERVEYGQVRLNDLRALRDQILQEITQAASATTGTRRYRFTVTSKGF